MKRGLLLTLMFSVVALAVVLAAGSKGLAQDDRPVDERVKLGLQMAPVPLNLTGKDRNLVGLGSYIVNAQAGCNDCHTNPSFAEGGNPFLGQPKQINAQGYLRGGVPFGPFVSRNLRPDAAGRPAGLKLEDFLLVMHTGVDLKHIPPAVPSPQVDLLQVMPWPVYGMMTDDDLRAVYEYLRALPQ
jgi:hypothetical protein